MKKIIMCAVFASVVILSQSAYADELVQMNNGMTCWRNDQGFMYGCSGGANTGDSGFNDVKTGDRYERINDNQAIDTRTGQPIDTPRREDNNDGSDNNE
jgi:hypothetical protein